MRSGEMKPNIANLVEDASHPDFKWNVRDDDGNDWQALAPCDENWESVPGPIEWIKSAGTREQRDALNAAMIAGDKEAWAAIAATIEKDGA